MLPLTHWLCLQAVLEQEARIAGFRSEVSKSQELHLASVTRDIERLSTQLEKIKAEIRCACAVGSEVSPGSWQPRKGGQLCPRCSRYEVDKLTSSQRLGEPLLCRNMAILLQRCPARPVAWCVVRPDCSCPALTLTWKRPAHPAAWRVDRPDLWPLRTDLNLEKNRIRDDLNSERNRMRDGLQGMRDKANELEIKMDKETNALRAAVEQSKNEVRMSSVGARLSTVLAIPSGGADCKGLGMQVIKWSLGLLFAVVSAGIAVARLVL